MQPGQAADRLQEQAEEPVAVRAGVQAADRQVPVEVLAEEQAGPEKLQALRNYRRMTGRL